MYSSFAADEDVWLQASLQDQNSGKANDARVAASYGVVAKVATGGKMSAADAEAGMVGAASLMNPAAGAMLAVGFGAVNVAAAEMEKAFHALGWDAHGVDWHPCDHPPAGPNDPRWAAASPTLQLQIASLDAGTFAAFAAPILYQNFFNWMNCRPSLDKWDLLARLAEQWNNAHEGPEQIWDLGVGGWKEHRPASGFGPAGWVQHDPFLRGYVEWDDDGSHRTEYPERDLPYTVLHDLHVNRGPLKPEYRPKYIGQSLRRALHDVPPPSHAGQMFAHLSLGHYHRPPFFVRLLQAFGLHVKGY